MALTAFAVRPVTQPFFANRAPSGITTGPFFLAPALWTCAESNLSRPRTVRVQHALPFLASTLTTADPEALAGPFLPTSSEPRIVARSVTTPVAELSAERDA